MVLLSAAITALALAVLNCIPDHPESISAPSRLSDLALGHPFNRTNLDPPSSTGGLLEVAPDSVGAHALAAAWPCARGRWGSDQILVAHRVVGDGEFEYPIEPHPAAAGATV